jgi:hypothetical protein
LHRILAEDWISSRTEANKQETRHWAPSAESLSGRKRIQALENTSEQNNREETPGGASCAGSRGKSEPAANLEAGLKGTQRKNNPGSDGTKRAGEKLGAEKNRFLAQERKRAASWLAAAERIQTKKNKIRMRIHRGSKEKK